MTDSAVATADPGGTPKPAVRIKRYLLVAALIFVMLVPGIALLFTPYSAAVGATIPGLLTAVLGVLVGGVRRGFAVTVIAILTIGVAPVGLLIPWLGVLFIVGLGIFIGYAAHSGMDLPIFTMNWLVAMTMLAPPALTSAALANGVTININYILALMAVTAAGGLWAFMVMCIATRKLPPRPLKRLPRLESIVYATNIAVFTGIAAIISLTWFKYSLAGWIILTIYTILRPTFKGTDVYHGARKKAWQRAYGTVAGVIVASIIAAFVHNPNVLLLIGVLLLPPALNRLLFGHPYWQYVVLFTPAMVFLDSNGVRAEHVAAERIFFTFVGLAMAMVAIWLNRAFVFGWIDKVQARRADSTPDMAP